MSHARLADKIKFLETFRNLDPNMPVSQILYLLAAAAQPGSGMRQLAHSAGVPFASASRYLTALSDGRPAVGLEGLGLVDAVENPLDRRNKMISLSDKGANLLAEIV